MGLPTTLEASSSIVLESRCRKYGLEGLSYLPKFTQNQNPSLTPELACLMASEDPHIIVGQTVEDLLWNGSEGLRAGSETACPSL